WLEYATDIYEGPSIVRMLNNLQTLLENVVANPDQRVGYVSLLNKDEQQQLFFDWNDTTTPYPDTLCMHQLFEAQLARTPDALALAFEPSAISHQPSTRNTQHATTQRV